eukprot:4143320-Pleurochrysis_carterae.AAC.1
MHDVHLYPRPDPGPRPDRRKYAHEQLRHQLRWIHVHDEARSNACERVRQVSAHVPAQTVRMRAYKLLRKL